MPLRTPALLAAAAVILGSIVGSALPLPALPLAVRMALLPLVAVRYRRRPLCMAVALIALAALATDDASRRLPERFESHLSGRWRHPPGYADGAWRGRLTGHVDGHAEPLRIAVSIADPGFAHAEAMEAIDVGAHARSWASLRRSDRPDIDATARVKSPLLVETIAPAGPVGRLLSRLRRAARSSVEGWSERRRVVGLLEALLLGRREGVAREDVRAFRRTGLAHLVSISGLHTAALIGSIAWLCGRVGIRRHGWALVALPLFAALVGGRTPVLRAAWAWGWLAVGTARGRRVDALAVTAWLLCAFVIWDPSAIASPSLQLTFAATLAILAALDSRIFERLPTPLAVSIAAQLATTPIAAWHFGQLTPLGPLANLVAVPLGTALVVAGYAALAIPPLGPLVGRGAELLLWLVHRLDRISPPAAVAPPQGWLVAIFGVGLIWLFLIPRRRRAAAWIVALCSATLLTGAPPRDAAAPRLSLLDVGQGQSVLLRGVGGTLLIDAGGSASPRYDPGEREVLPALLARGLRRIDALAISHADIDHAGGAAAILRELEVGRLWIAAGAYAELDELRALARRRGTGIVLVGRAGVQGWPLVRSYEALDCDSDNDRSLVLSIDGALIPGDIESCGEAAFLASFSTPRAELLVLPHHGSRSSSSPAFLEAVGPSLAVVSCGRDNRFGHPHAEVLERLEGTALWRTDRDGELRFERTEGGWVRR